MKKRWWFTEYSKQVPARWTWRVLSGDGTIDQQSGEFESYGMAVRDAINRGFQPSRDHWAIETTVTVTHFHHGSDSVVILKGDRHPLIQAPAALRSTKPSATRKRLLQVAGRD